MLNRKKILVAENDPLNLEFFDLMLGKLGFIVEKASDGQQAMDKIADFSPDLILLETVMPKISGWEILKTVRNNPKTEALPVLLLSKMDDVKDIVEGFELGADDYIIKPFNFSVLLARVRAALRSRVLISELNARESRLALAETLNDDMRKNLTDFQRSIDGIAEAISLVKKDVLDAQALSGLVTLINEKVSKVRKNLEVLEDRMHKTENEWEGLKKKEIDFPILEKPIRDTVSY